MISTAILYMITYGLFSGLLVIGLYLSEAKERTVKARYRNQGVNLEELTVLIPFRNEAARLAGLIESLNRSERLPKYIYFIDDGSTDDGAALLQQQLQLENYAILSGNGEGKKAALRTGMSRATTDYVLTMDSDIRFSPTYFSGLETLPDSDLLILPVLMKGRGLKVFFELDVHLANALNTACAGLLDPIMASGANLLFRRKAFEEHDRYEQHRHLASGDDQFLLRDFKKARARILLCTDPVHQVTTAVPGTIRELVDQRVRWFSKSSEVGDNFATVLALIQLVFTLGFIVLLFFSFFKGDYPLCIALLFLRTIVDLFAYGSYFQRIERLPSLILLPLYELLFPFYGMLIVFLSLTYRPRWKGRPIRT